MTPSPWVVPRWIPDAAIALFLCVEATTAAGIGPFLILERDGSARFALLAVMVLYFIATAAGRTGVRGETSTARSAWRHTDLLWIAVVTMAIVGLFVARANLPNEFRGAYDAERFRRAIAFFELGYAARFTTAMFGSLVVLRCFEAISVDLRPGVRRTLAVLSLGLAVFTTAGYWVFRFRHSFRWTDLSFAAIGIPAMVGFAIAAKREKARPVAWLGVAAALLLANHAVTTRAYRAIEVHVRTCIPPGPDTPLRLFSGPELHAATIVADAISGLAVLAILVGTVSMRSRGIVEAIERRMLALVVVVIVSAQFPVVHAGRVLAPRSDRPASLRVPTFDSRRISTRSVAETSRNAFDVGDVRADVAFGQGPTFPVVAQDDSIVTWAREAPLDGAEFERFALRVGLGVRAERRNPLWEMRDEPRRVVPDAVRVVAPGDMPLGRIDRWLADQGDWSVSPRIALIADVDVHLEQPGFEPRPDMRLETWVFLYTWAGGPVEATGRDCSCIELFPGGRARWSGRDPEHAWRVELVARKGVTVRELISATADLRDPVAVRVADDDRLVPFRCQPDPASARRWRPFRTTPPSWRWLVR